MTTDMRTDAAPRRRRHLMDPAHPVRPVNDRALTNVQRWVMSTLMVFTTAHLAAGMVVAALEIDPAATAARAGLNVIAGAFMAIAVVAGRAIHHRSALTWWLVAAPLTTAVGAWLTFR